MIKTITTAAVILSIASSAMAGTVIQSLGFGGDQGGGTSVYVVTNATAAAYQTCKAEVEAEVRKDLNEYNGTVVVRKSDSGSTTPGSTNNTWLSYEVVIKYPFPGHSVYSCTYFR